VYMWVPPYETAVTNNRQPPQDVQQSLRHSTQVQLSVSPSYLCHWQSLAVVFYHADVQEF